MTSHPVDALVLQSDDDVASALRDIGAGEEVRLSAGGTLLAVNPIPLGHKIALSDLPTGQPVRKYGAVIGSTTSEVAAGEHVHLHNLTGLRRKGEGRG